MDNSTKVKMEILDAIADMDPVYQQQLRQLAEKEKQFDQLIAALPDDQRAVAWEFVMLCEDMSQRKQRLACRYMEYTGLRLGEQEPEPRKIAAQIVHMG